MTINRFVKKIFKLILYVAILYICKLHMQTLKKIFNNYDGIF